MTEIIENGTRYEIQDGLVVEASATDAPSDVLEIKPSDRVSYKTKLGNVVGIIPSIYGDSAIVKFDDGSIDELHVDHLNISNERVASFEPSGSLVEEYDAYRALPTDTTEDIRIKEDKARELNLRAKAHVTNGKLPLADQIAYDKIVTATAVDILDLHDAALFAQAADDSYVESLPKYRLPEEISNAFGVTRGGDASWLMEAAESMPVEDQEDAELVSRANNSIAQFSRKQLEDDDLMDLALTYANDALVATADKKERFSFFFREARAQRLADEEAFQKNASVDETVDMNGNKFNLDETPVEAIFGA